jgi:hypothetical protein
MTDTHDRPMLRNAREAADSYLLHKVVDDGMASGVAQNMATVGFATAARTLSTLRTRDGLSEDAIEQGFRRKLAEARAAGDEQRVIAAEYTLAIWGGLRTDLAAYLGSVGE